MSIELNEVTVHYPTSPEPSLRNFTARLQGKSVTLLVGTTGSGKSTLLDVISGLVPPTSGRVTVDNLNLWSGAKPERKILLRFGSVFQYPEHQLFAKSVQGEFTYSLHPMRLNKAQILTRAQTSLRYVDLPESILPESPFILSGGQKRRVALASTFATEPDWLFLDEPTAGLDPAAVHQLVSFVQRFTHRFSETEADRSSGIVIATHDLDVFLPIADEIILLQNGKMSRHIQTHELFQHPEWLVDIGIALPPSLQIHAKLRECSEPDALDLQLPARYLNPEEMANVLLESMHGKRLSQIHSADPDGSTVSRQSAPAPKSETDPQMGSPIQSRNESLQYVKRGFSALDPRTKWLLCLFLSASMLIQSNWIGLSLSISTTVGLLVWSRVGMQTIMRYTKPVLFVLLMSVLLAALQFGHAFHIGPVHGIGLGIKPAIVTLKGFIGFLCVVEIGLLLPATTSSQDMNQGLAQLLSPLRKLHIPVDALALSASLLLRFIPLILLQLQRFSRIAKARGKRSTRRGGISARDMPAVVIPLILAVLKLAEDLSLAMEARGYRHAGQKRTVYQIFYLSRADYFVLTTTGLVSLLLVGLRLWA